MRTIGRIVAVVTALALSVTACSGEGAVPTDPAEDDAPDPSGPADQDETSGVPEPDDGPDAEREPAPGSDAEEPGSAPTSRDAIRDPSRAPLRTPVRAVWVHLFDDTLKSPEGIDRLVDELVAAEATAVIAQVARRHDAYYDSAVLPATTDPALAAGHDVIEALTDRAHEAGIEVHAWISIAPTTHAVYDELPAIVDWLTTAHGRDAPEAERWVSRTAEGTWTDYLDPALPEVRTHVTDIVRELAASTEVDGIHLDYARYEHERAGYHPRALERFVQEMGGSASPAADDPAWVAWRQEQTRQLVAAAREVVDRAERPVALTAATITWGEAPSSAQGFATTRPATEALQDWPGWVRDGIVDAVLPMNYFREHEAEQAGWRTGWLAFEGELAASTEGTLVVPGIGGWLNRDDAVLTQLGEAIDGTDGAALYSYQQPTETTAAPGGDDLRPFLARLGERSWGVAR
ncbi:MAG: family 10 glycosylhydrolase [Nitriliruptoraceae bacterium]|nr:family 10 glycosylhydrolase [Nitriliruptoraceae bacterium]